MTTDNRSHEKNLSEAKGNHKGGEASSQNSGETGTSEGESPSTQSKSQLSLLERLREWIPFKRNASLRQDLEVVLEKGDDDLTFSPEERAMLQNILRLREVRADDIMIPRVDIDAVDVSITIGELLFLFEESRHSRMPVYRETLDDPLGMVHVKDVMGYVMEQAEKNPEAATNEHGQLRNDVVDYDLSSVDLSKPLSDIDILRPVLFVPPSMPATDIFARMQTGRSQLALVIDEYGGTDGLISMEDVVEVIVGDIEDEHDDNDEGPGIVNDRPGRWIADAKLPLHVVAETLNVSLDSVEVEGEDVVTLGGLIFTKLGRVPVRGEVVRAIEGFDLEIMDVDIRRIRRVRIVETKTAGKRRRGRERAGSGAVNPATEDKNVGDPADMAGGNQSS